MALRPSSSIILARGLRGRLLLPSGGCERLPALIEGHCGGGLPGFDTAGFAFERLTACHNGGVLKEVLLVGVSEGLLLVLAPSGWQEHRGRIFRRALRRRPPSLRRLRLQELLLFLVFGHSCILRWFGDGAGIVVVIVGVQVGKNHAAFVHGAGGV